MKKTFDKVAEVIRDVMSRTICILEEPHYPVRESKQQKVCDFRLFLLLIIE